MFSADSLLLRHEMELSNWQIDPALAPGVFASQKAQSAKRIPFANPAAAPPPGVARSRPFVS
jgi:Predicted periplasmic protein (DUF2092)